MTIVNGWAEAETVWEAGRTARVEDLSGRVGEAMKQQIDKDQNRSYHNCGLQCPNCACKDFRVVYTRPAYRGGIMRRWECRNCGKRITTWEKQVR